ncbi:MAG TPA: ABC transporter substrate binding protein [Casimicrobiaceae bacterium]|nr:ABC transporter substrate binding protein [Casimicrobiaceae bacterium]
MRQRAATLVLTFAAALAASALAAPRVLLYATDDTPQLRAAQRGVREALGATPIVEIPAGDAGARLKAAAHEDPDAAIITLGPQAALRAARDAPSLAAVDCMSTQAGASAQAVPAAIPLEQQLSWLRRLLPDAHYIGVLYDPAQNTELVDALAAALRGADLNPVLAPVATPAMLPAALARLSSSADALLAVPDTTVYKRETVKALLLFSFRHKLPLIGLSETWVQAGALYALDWDYRELGAFCGRLALRQLPGARAAAPTPPHLHVYVNQRSARLFRVRWDESVRESLERVVE